MVEQLSQTPMEPGIERKKKHPRRWMPGERSQNIQSAAWEMLRLAGRMLPGFLLSFADILGIPSGLHGAYMAAVAVMGESLLWPAGGCMLAFLMRLVWGLGLRLDMLATMGLLLISPAVIFGKGIWWMMGWTALSLLPGVVGMLIAGTAADALVYAGSMLIGALSAPVMLRALRVLKGSKPIAAMEERVAVGYLGGMLLCGGARMLLFPLNVGAVGAAFATLSMALFLGVGPGALIGMISGLTLALQGLPLTLAVALSLGGFLAGMIQCLGRRWLTCASFALGCALAMLLMGASGHGCIGAAVAPALTLALLPRNCAEGLQNQCRRFLSVTSGAGDGYAAAALHRWEETMAAMAKAVPSPDSEDGPRTASWWKCRLCSGCPDDADCTCMLTELARDHAEAVWRQREEEDEAWTVSLENLRGLGCGRLYHLRESMDALRKEQAQQAREAVRLMRQRDMLVTHLTAMAGAAQRFARLSSGESWWDDMSARQLRRSLAESAYPAGLLYARRVQGHARVGFELQRIAGAKEQAEELCTMTSKTLNTPMLVARVSEDRVTLAEQPLWSVECACASCGLDNSEICGDTALYCTLEDGRLMTALSDGMGHGSAASQESRQTTQLLRLCLEAGYTRQQTLTAVNGMMLLRGQGERFATVDMALVDLWTGTVSIDKLGAAASWLIRGREMTEITGSGLPLGILEEIDSQGVTMRLREGDQLLMMTDGIEDAFDSRDQLRDALLKAADASDASAAAWSLLHSAEQGEGQGGQDDRTAAVLRITRTVQMAQHGI